MFFLPFSLPTDFGPFVDNVQLIVLKKPKNSKRGDVHSQWKGSVPPILVDNNLYLNL